MARWLSPLGVRIAAALIAVALAAIAVFTVLTVTSTQRQLESLITRTHAQDARAAAAAAARAYEDADGWPGADFGGALAVAARGQATLTVLDASGTIVAVPADEAADLLRRIYGIEVVDVPRSDPISAPVEVGGIPVGSIQLSFPASHLPGPEMGVRDALVRTALIGALVAVATAVAVALFVARRLSTPLVALTDAAAMLGSGRRGVRVALHDAPGELGTLSVAFDRMADSLEGAESLRRQLVRDVAHEVRTPLTILRGTTEALVDGVMEPDAATLRSLHDEVLRLSRVVGDLEMLAAAEAAALHLESGPVDLADVAGAALELARASAADADIALAEDLSPAPATGDDGRLRQVTINLLSNALRYTPAGGHVQVRTATEDGAAVLEVLDDGPGIDDEDLPHLFERFYRGSVGRATDGSGIGLAVVAELIEAHGGRIEAMNRPGGGARFVVRLPSA